MSSVLLDDSVWPYITDDFFPLTMKDKMAEMFLKNPNVYVLAPNRHSVFVLTPRNGICYEGHVNILPPGRGRQAVKAEKRVIGWMFANTSCAKILGFTPAAYRHVILFHQLCGMKREGCSRKSFMKNGILYDEIITGITKEDWSWPQA